MTDAHIWNIIALVVLSCYVLMKKYAEAFFGRKTGEAEIALSALLVGSLIAGPIIVLLLFLFE